MASRILKAIGWTTILAVLALWSAALVAADLNQDEGWYLYAGRMAAEGRVPYRDFAFTQGPVMAYVYALAWPVVRVAGVLGGRLFTAGLGLAATGLAVVLARALAPAGRAGTAALLALMLAALNVYQAAFMCTVKTYALAAVWCVGAALAYVRAWHGGGRRYAALAGALIALATATRLSAGALAPPLLVALWLERRRLPRVWGWFAGGGLVAGVLVLLPFYLAAPEGVRFGLLEYHAGRDPGGALAMLVYKGGFIARVVRAYTGAILGGLILLSYGRTVAGPERRLSLTLLAGVGAVTLLHLAAPFPYDDYQVFVYPLAAALLAAQVAAQAPAAAPARLLAIALLGLLLLCGASPTLQDWAVRGRDRLWWRLREEPPLLRLRAAGRAVRERLGGDALLLTQDLYLAVEAGARVPSGLELGPFSYYPDWSDERTARLRVLNRARLLALLDQAPAPVAAFSGYGMAIAAPALTETPPEEMARLWTAVTTRYAPWREIADFGQGDTVLRLLIRRPADEETP